MSRTSVATDNFNRAGPALGSNWTNINTYTSGDVLIDSSIRIRGEYSVQATDEKPTAYWSGSGTQAADQYASLRFATAPTGGASIGIGVVVRASGNASTRNCYEAWVDASTSNITYLTKRVGGTRTVLHSSTTPTWTTNDYISLEAEGTTLRLCKNGTPLGGSFTTTDSSLSSGSFGVIAAGYPGFYGDDWEGGNLSSGVTITDAGDETFLNGETGITITGSGFGSSQGSGFVKISPTNSIANGSAVTQTINGWGASSINMTAVRGALAYNTNMYLFVQDTGGLSNASGYVVQFLPDKKLKLLVHSSAASATSIAGVVFAAPTGGAITGAEIGEFTGKTFEASLESGQAVLKVNVVDFGGTALSTGSTPVVLVRNGTNTTGIVNATIIEE